MPPGDCTSYFTQFSVLIISFPSFFAANWTTAVRLSSSPLLLKLQRSLFYKPKTIWSYLIHKPCLTLLITIYFLKPSPCLTWFFTTLPALPTLHGPLICNISLCYPLPPAQNSCFLWLQCHQPFWFICLLFGDYAVFFMNFSYYYSLNPQISWFLQRSLLIHTFAMDGHYHQCWDVAVNQISRVRLH